jgi:hypothetical protein
MATPQGHAQTKLIGPDNRTGVRTALGYWNSAEWDLHRDQEWHAPLHSAFKSSMLALQRHEQTDDQAAMLKASGGPQTPPDEKIEHRFLTREMDTLENFNLDRIAANITAARNSLSPFSSPLDKSDVPRAMVRMQIRADLKAMTPDKLRAALRAADETMSSAILEAPHYSSGLAPDMYQNFREQRLRVLHPEKLQSLDAANAAVKLTARCLDAARQSTRTRIAPFLPNVESEPKNAAQPWVS